VGKLKRGSWTAADYERAAVRYCLRLPLEHFMEAIPHSTQRGITMASLELLKVRRPDVQVFGELLVQYFYKGRLRQVVPDNMVRLCTQPPVTTTSFNLELEPVGPLLVLEYVSIHNVRKDYKDNLLRYEQELHVPYYLLFYPEKQDLRLHHHTGEKYERVLANAARRLEIPELELEAAIQDRWVRFWHRGELLLLPGELEQRAEQEKQRAEQEKQRAEQEKQRAEQAEAEVARLRALLGQQQGPAPRPPRKRK
jgi:Uma2 family endonuclease